jgi:acetate kinase
MKLNTSHHFPIMTSADTILTINGGSSSIKFALFQAVDPLVKLLGGEMENIGTGQTKFSFSSGTDQKTVTNIKAADHNEAAVVLIDWLGRQAGFASVKVIGHRIVQGMGHTQPQEATVELVNGLKKLSALDPEHLPIEIEMIEIFRKHYPALLQVVCFDTMFHASMPDVAKLLSIPRRYYQKGIRRYGFHGLSYAYLLEGLNQTAGKEIAQGRVILAHLGSGASLAAVSGGKSIDTSMGFTPAAGLPMATRTGDLDPGVAYYLMQTEKLDPTQFNHMINHESGLLGISETTADMRELVKNQSIDTRAAEAVELFCYQAKKWIGAYAAALGGLDTLVFSGGIGENAPEIRDRICRGLGFLGIEIDKSKNSKNEAIISAPTGSVSVRVIPTNEELMIARFSQKVLDSGIK